MQIGERVAGALRHLRPAASFAGGRETLRATLAVALALALLELLLRPVRGTGEAGLFLIPPLAASSVILFAVPNSPMAQPWPALLGNCLSAAVAVASVLWIDDPALRVPVAAASALLLMHLARALHPPGGAVAVLGALNPEIIQKLGFGFVLAPVGLGTLCLILLAIPFARLTGRYYPFRQPEARQAKGADDRLAVSRDELAALLQEFRQSTNIGVEDLARLIVATERLAAQHQAEGIPVAEVMSHDLVTVRQDARLSEVAGLFRQHGFTSLPVLDNKGRYLGLIFQIHLIRSAEDLARATQGGFVAAMARRLAPGREDGLRAADLMDATVPHLAPDAPASALMPLLARGHCDAIPVLDDRGPDGPALVGVVTRTDLVSLLARLPASRATGGS